MAAALAQPGQRPLGHVENLGYVISKTLAFRRDDELARRAAEQFDAEQFLQAFQLRRDGGDREIEAGGGNLQGAVAGDDLERAQLGQIEVVDFNGHALQVKGNLTCLSSYSIDVNVI